MTGLRASDREAIVALAGDLAVARWLERVPHPYTLADADAFLLSDVAGASRAIRLRRVGDQGHGPGDALIGIIGLGDTPRGWALGYWLGRPFWGRGFATEAGRAVVAAARAVADRPRLVAGYFEGNAASARVLDKLGFVETGRSRRTALALGREVTHVDMVHCGDL